MDFIEKIKVHNYKLKPTKLKAVYFTRDERSVESLKKLLGKDLLSITTEKMIGGKCQATTKQGVIYENQYVFKYEDGSIGCFSEGEFEKWFELDEEE